MPSRNPISSRAETEPPPCMKEFSWPVRVFYEDTDAAGLVYHGNYLKFMERTRTEWLRDLGHSHDQLAGVEGIRFVVTRVNIRFLRPARLDDLLEVRARIRECLGARILFDQSIHGQDRKLLCQAEVEVGCLDARTMKPRRIPESIRTEFADVH